MLWRPRGGGNPAATTQVARTALTTFLDDLTAADILADLDLLYVMAARTEAESRLNLAAPGTFSLVNIDTPAFTANAGWKGNGSSDALDTGFTASSHGVNYTLNDASLWVWSLENIAQNSTSEIGEVAGTDRSYFNPRTAVDVFEGRINDGTTLSVASVTDSTGMIGIQRTAADARAAWRNGASIGSDTTASTSVSSHAFRICGATATNFGVRRLAIAAVGASLTGKEDAFYDICGTYLTAVGAI